MAKGLEPQRHQPCMKNTEELVSRPSATFSHGDFSYRDHCTDSPPFKTLKSRFQNRLVPSDKNKPHDHSAYTSKERLLGGAPPSAPPIIPIQDISWASVGKHPLMTLDQTLAHTHNRPSQRNPATYPIFGPLPDLKTYRPYHTSIVHNPRRHKSVAIRLKGG